MGIGEIIYSMITLILMVLIIFSPLLRKIAKSAEKNKGDREKPIEDIYESVDSHRVVQRILSDDEQTEHITFNEPKALRQVEKYIYDEKVSAIDKIDKMSKLKRAIVWKEILSAPVAMRHLGRDDYL